MSRQDLSVCLVIPTYNEAGNIEALLARLTELDQNLRILVVDDESPDGTADLVRSCARENPRIHLSSGPKAGLGAGYKRGMLLASGDLEADVLIQMDADFSHDPADVPRLIELIHEGADVAIGSRHVKGGQLDEKWGLVRRLLTYGGNFLIRLTAGIQGVQDCTSGFRAIRSSMLKKVDVENLPVDGYAFQVALLDGLLQQGAKVVELPIYFRDRVAGETKLRLSDLIEFFVYALVLGFSRGRGALPKFLVTGGTGTVVNVLAFQGMICLEVNKYLASLAALEISILWNFCINDMWTFRHTQPSAGWLKRNLRFHLASVTVVATSFGIFVLLVHLFPQWPLWLAQLLAILPAVPLSYYFSSRWVFRR